VGEDDDDPFCGEVIVCQGPPICDLMDDDAVAAQNAGCRWCKRILVGKEGVDDHIIEPGRA
jgi:hypothetical protein